MVVAVVAEWFNIFKLNHLFCSKKKLPIFQVEFVIFAFDSITARKFFAVSFFWQRKRLICIYHICFG